MTATQNSQKQSEMVSTASRELDDVINNAIKKVGGSKENDLCRYLPMSSGGYMHHFTFKKKKSRVPRELCEEIKNFILTPSKPTTVAPKQRAARGSRKKKDQIVLTKNDIDRILHMARAIGDKDVIRKLTPKKDLRQIKRELLSSIRNLRVEPELWHNYVETVSQPQATV